MKITTCVDWLRFTVPHDWSIDDTFGTHAEWVKLADDNKQAKAYPGYTHALRLEYGRMDWHWAKPQQRRMFTFTGNDLLRLRRAEYRTPTLLAATIADEVNVTRCDIAIDIRDAGLEAAELYRAYRAGKMKTRSQKVTVIGSQGDPNDSPATTMYVGARTSKKMLRVYDKGRMSKPFEDWLRIEIETKKEIAKHMVKRAVQTSEHEAACEVINDTAQFDVEWWGEVINPDADLDLTLGAKQTNWEKWITDVVLPNVVKAVYADVEGVRDTVRGLNIWINRNE